MKKIAVLFVFIAFFIAGCGSDSDSDFDKLEKDAENAEKSDNEKGTNEEGTDEENLKAEYPEVTPTSNKNGDVAQNITIFDDQDVEHHLEEWYKPNNKSSKLIWLIFTTYDCAPCRQLKEDLLEINKAEYRKQGLKIILVFNGLLDGPQPELEPEKLANYKEMFLSEYPDTAKFEIYGYLKKEEQKVFKKFTSAYGESTVGNGGAYPTWAFIDASTMEIVDWGEGWGTGMVKPACDEIEFLLEEL